MANLIAELLVRALGIGAGIAALIVSVRSLF